MNAPVDSTETTARNLKTWIQTFKGRKFYPLDPKPSEIDIRDIARALSMLCRYNGHVARFYSVGEHSVRVARRVYQKTRSHTLAFWGLLHDASEAYLSDITRPVKHQAALAGYREAEKTLQAAICGRFGLDPVEPQAVTDADLEILGSEAEQLKSPIHKDWHKTTKSGHLPAPIPGLGRLGWSPARAEREFLKLYRALVAQFTYERSLEEDREVAADLDALDHVEGPSPSPFDDPFLSKLVADHERALRTDAP